MPLYGKGEKVVLEESGVYLGTIAKGTAILTNQRVIFEAKVGSFLQKSSETLLDLPLTEIKNLQVRKGFLTKKAVVIEASMTSVSSTLKSAFDLTPGQLFQIALNVKDPKKWADEIQRAISEA